jgi:hypothetical protein
MRHQVADGFNRGGKGSNGKPHDPGPDNPNPRLLVGDAGVHSWESTGFDDPATVNAERNAAVAEGW